jgi:hypothetical protein
MSTTVKHYGQFLCAYTLYGEVSSLRVQQYILSNVSTYQIWLPVIYMKRIILEIAATITQLLTKA